MVPGHWPHFLSCKDVLLQCFLIPFCLPLSCALPFVTVEFWNVLAFVYWLEKVMIVAVIGENAYIKRNISINLKLFLHFFFSHKTRILIHVSFFWHKYILLKTGEKIIQESDAPAPKTFLTHCSAQVCCNISLLQNFFLNFQGATSSYCSEIEYYPSESDRQVLLS